MESKAKHVHHALAVHRAALVAMAQFFIHRERYFSLSHIAADNYDPVHFA
jgi:hypothetical protein